MHMHACACTSLPIEPVAVEGARGLGGELAPRVRAEFALAVGEELPAHARRGEERARSLGQVLRLHLARVFWFPVIFFWFYLLLLVLALVFVGFAGKPRQARVEETNKQTTKKQNKTKRSRSTPKPMLRYPGD